MNKKLMTNKDYHNHKAVGSTLLKKISKTTVVHALEQEFKTSAEMDIGSCLHSLLLAPETFKNEFAISPDVDRRTRAGKEEWALFLEKSGDKTILQESDFEIVNKMFESVKTHSIANAILTGGEAEYSYFTKCKKTGLELKCRPDYVNKNSLIDLKTAKDASALGFEKACANLGYHIQAAYYLDVYNAANKTDLKDFYFIVVENTAPFGVAVYQLHFSAIEYGRYLYQKALVDLANYLTDSKLKDFKKLKYIYGEDIKEIDLPNWAYSA